MDRGGHPFEVEIAAVRQDGGETGANGVSLDQGNLPHPHPTHVGDGVVRTRLEDARRHAKPPRPHLAGGWGGGQNGEEEQGEGGSERHPPNIPVSGRAAACAGTAGYRVL